MGLAWQQGPLAPGAIGTFFVPDPLPERMLYAEPLRRRMRVMFGGAWIAQSDGVVILHEPGRYPVAYFPKADIADGVLGSSERTTGHPELGRTAWYVVRAAWSYRDAYREVDRIDDAISFEPDKVTVTIDGERLELAPGQRVVAHGPDRGLTPDEAVNPVLS